ncbi:MAG TPA: 16S rRNA (guanine(966)-N(2))-methyltransferase RsmD [Solirubrobacteraceae bacterium]|nr:16S rRNA (guanine(966)-N(2))-methyltransferase RsmD [Solirubrobacteraceae bacterium]
MRIVAGTHRGRRVAAPAGHDVRPTSDRVREALFAILESSGGGVAGRHVLDLFAGSGALGLEALSRGAASAVFVDRSPRAVAAVRGNLETLELSAAVHRREALAHLRAASARGDAYDLCFLDPPYRQAPGLGPRLGAALPAVLAPGARVVVESDHRAPPALGLAVVDERRYGDTLIRIHHDR